MIPRQCRKDKGIAAHELEQRKRVYPRLVASGQMRQSVADFYTGDMQAVRATLQWCAENRDLIVELKAENTRLRAELEGMRASRSTTVERVA